MPPSRVKMVPTEPDVSFTPSSDWIKIRINYDAGVWSYVKKNAASVTLLQNHRAAVVGVSTVDGAPVLIRKDPNMKGDPPATAYAPTLGGTGAGTRLLNAESSQFIALVNPTVGVMREGWLSAFKKYLFNPTTAPRGDRAEEKRREEGAFMATDLMQGRLARLPTAFGYSAHRKAISPTNIENSGYCEYGLPVFKISMGNIPAVATESIAEWMARHPKDFIYMQVAIQKILQWIWLVTHPTMGRESKVPPDKHELEVPPLADWLRVAHLYETWHQINQLAFYLHPFRFVKRFLKSPLVENRQPPSPDSNLEDVVVLLAPLARSPLGLVLPSAFRGSTMPDLARMEPRWGFLPRTDELLASVNQPDWRSLYFPSLPLWDEWACVDGSKNKGFRVGPANGTREIWIPSAWNPRRVVDRIRSGRSAETPAVRSDWLTSTQAVPLITARRVCEGDNTDREVIVGPTQFQGAQPAGEGMTRALESFYESFTKEPCWALVQPCGSKAPVWTPTGELHILELLKTAHMKPAGKTASPEKPPKRKATPKKKAEPKTDDPYDLPDYSDVADASDSGSQTGKQAETNPGDPSDGTRLGTHGDDIGPSLPTRDVTSPIQLVPLNIPGTGAPLPAGMAQMTSSQLWGPVAVNWWYFHNSARLQWAIDNGIQISQLSVSPLTGLLTAPGMEDEKFIPEEASAVEPTKVEDEEGKMWTAFLDDFTMRGQISPYWQPLVDMVLQFLAPGSTISRNDLRLLAFEKLSNYLSWVIPVFLAYVFLGNPPRQLPVEEWFKGSDGNGRLTMDIVVENIINIMGSPPNAAEDAFFLVNGFDRYPGHICKNLENFLARHTHKKTSRIFRHLFAEDETFKKSVMEKVEASIGVYPELDLGDWLPPLNTEPDTVNLVESSDDDEGMLRNRKRQRIEGPSVRTPH